MVKSESIHNQSLGNDPWISECKKKTRIRYLNQDGFFKPKLKGINHLEVGYSKIISSPVTIIAEFFYLIYKNLRSRIKKLHDRLFPRRPRVYADRLDSYLCGKVTHLGRYGVNDPIHNLKLEFWARRRFSFQFRKLGETHTDHEGKFHLPFTLRQARRFMNRSLRLDVMLPYEVMYVQGKPQTKYRIYHTQFIPKKELIGLGYNLNGIPLPLWEYRTDTPLPRTYFPEDTRFSPEIYDVKREDALIQQIIPIELTKQKHLFQIHHEPGVLTLEQIQQDYPENLTVCIEKKHKGYTRSDAWFVERMINGMNKATLQADQDQKGIYHIKFWGIGYYDHNHEYALPDVDIVLHDRGEALPELKEIKFTGALNAINQDPWQEHVFRPTDGEKWLAAKRLARVCGAVAAETDEHFAGTHVNTEQYTIAAYRNFRKNPVAWLLFPHLKEVSLINAAADKTIIGGYLPTATALTEKGLKQRVYDAMGFQNWKGWKPMKPLHSWHTYAHAENLFWDLLGEYIDFFFAEYEVDIKKEWSEVYFFSKDLVEHSVRAFGELEDHATDERSIRRLKELKSYLSEVFAYHQENSTEIIHGQRKVISPITQSMSFEKESDFQHLKQACRYAIMMATFSHTWINEHQYDDLGEILYSCGGLRFGENEIGVMAPESDLSIAPDLSRATTMLWFTNLLSRTEYGFITRNEEKDIHPYFIQLLLDNKERFAALGVDIESIESRTNI